MSLVLLLVTIQGRSLSHPDLLFTKAGHCRFLDNVTTDIIHYESKKVVELIVIAFKIADSSVACLLPWQSLYVR